MKDSFYKRASYLDISNKLNIEDKIKLSNLIGEAILYGIDSLHTELKSSQIKKK
jgi:hypothetical protein